MVSDASLNGGPMRRCGGEGRDICFCGCTPSLLLLPLHHHKDGCGNRSASAAAARKPMLNPTQQGHPSALQQLTITMACLPPPLRCGSSQGIRGRIGILNRTSSGSCPPVSAAHATTGQSSSTPLPSQCVIPGCRDVLLVPEGAIHFCA